MFGLQQSLGTTASGVSSNAASNEKFTEFVKQVAGEMSTWEGAGLWQLSVLCPIKDFPLIPGFEDTSCEELRVAAYAAKTDAAAMQEYQKMLSEKMARHKQLRDAFRSGTAEAVQVLRELFNKAHKVDAAAGSMSNSSSTTSLFGKPQGSVFGATSSTFGAASTTSNSNSLFGSSSSAIDRPGMSLFSKPQTTNTFGSSSAFGSLGSSTGAGLFGAPQQTTSIFGSSGSSAFGMSDAVKPSLFGAPSGTSIFDSNAMPHSSTAGSSLFGGTATNTNSNSLFGSVIGAKSSVFGGDNASNSVFGTQPSASGGSVFSAPSSNAGSSIFGAPASAVTASPFGNPAASSNIFGSSNTDQNSNEGIANAASAVFGQASTGATSNVFGGSGSTSLQGGSKSIFSSVDPSVQSQTFSLFGGASSAGSTQFSSAPSTTQSVFGSTTFSSTSSIFGNSNTTAVQQGSVFGGSLSATASVGGNGSVVGSQSASFPVSSVHSSTSAAASPDDERYSQINQLQESDREQFCSDKFSYVPCVPPPRELCI